MTVCSDTVILFLSARSISLGSKLSPRNVDSTELQQRICFLGTIIALLAIVFWWMEVLQLLMSTEPPGSIQTKNTQSWIPSILWWCFYWNPSISLTKQMSERMIWSCTCSVSLLPDLHWAQHNLLKFSRGQIYFSPAQNFSCAEIYSQ